MELSACALLGEKPDLVPAAAVAGRPDVLYIISGLELLLSLCARWPVPGRLPSGITRRRISAYFFCC